MAGRDEGFPIPTSDNKACQTICEDNDEKYVVLQKATQRRRDALMHTTGASSSGSAPVTTSKAPPKWLRKATPPPGPDEDEADYDPPKPTPEEYHAAWQARWAHDIDGELTQQKLFAFTAEERHMKVDLKDRKKLVNRSDGKELFVRQVSVRWRRTKSVSVATENVSATPCVCGWRMRVTTELFGVTPNPRSV